MKGHTRKRGNKWAFVIDEGRHEDGRRRQRWHSGFRTQTEAHEALVKTLHQLNNGAYVAPNKVTVGDWFREWLARTSPRPSTRALYETLTMNYIVPALGGTPLQRLTTGQVNAFYRGLESKGGRKGALSPKTIRHIHATLRAAVNAAVAEGGIVHRNVVTQASPPKLERREMLTWSAAELKRFLGAVEDERLYPAFVLAASTGARRGEVLGVRWRDLDLDGATLTVRQALIVVNYRVITSSPKTDGARRSIALDPDTVAALRAWRARVLEERLVLGLGAPGPDTLVFTREDGSHLHPGEFAKHFRRPVKAAGVPAIRYHDLRHTHASLCLLAGVHVKVVSERLGHSSVAITLDTYSHVIPAMDADAAVRVMQIVKSA